MIGKPSISLDQILSKVSEIDILNYYFKIDRVPIVISSPLRIDKHPSFGFYSSNGNKIHWIDFSNKESGGTFDLLMKYWDKNYQEVLLQVLTDLPNIITTNNHVINTTRVVSTRNPSIKTDLKCKVREWKDHDIAYWNSFGVSVEWLKYAEVYPISHTILIREDGQKHIFLADKYAYAYVERKEGKITLKIYQPFNTKGYKWFNKHNKSVISLWTKVPEIGDKIIICSSMKDALCVWSNTGIPCIAIQAEGYTISDTAVNELRRRYKEIYILLDNDEAGLKDGLSLSKSTGFINLVLPKYEGAKDSSDLYKALNNKEKFKQVIFNLINEV